MKFYKFEYLVLNQYDIISFFRLKDTGERLEEKVINEYIEKGPRYNLYVPVDKDKDEMEYVKYYKDDTRFFKDISCRLNLSKGYRFLQYERVKKEQVMRKDTYEEFLTIHHDTLKDNGRVDVALNSKFYEDEFFIISIKHNKELIEQSMKAHSYITKFEEVDLTMDEVINNIKNTIPESNHLIYKLNR